MGLDWDRGRTICLGWRETDILGEAVKRGRVQKVDEWLPRAVVAWGRGWEGWGDSYGVWDFIF